MSSGSDAAVCPLENAEYRTIFASNVSLTPLMCVGKDSLQGYVRFVHFLKLHCIDFVRFILLPPKMAYLVILINLGKC